MAQRENYHNLTFLLCETSIESIEKKFQYILRKKDQSWKCIKVEIDTFWHFVHLHNSEAVVLIKTLSFINRLFVWTLLVLYNQTPA